MTERVYLKDYEPSGYEITKTYLDVHIISDRKVEVRSLLFGRKRIASTRLQSSRSNETKYFKALAEQNSPLILNGEDLVLREVRLNKEKLTAAAYLVTDNALILNNPPSVFALATVVWINPQKNVRLEGLFASGSILCTQNEATGFSRITYYLDRPDVLSKFTIRLSAVKKRYPTLLAGGQLIGYAEKDTDSNWIDAKTSRFNENKKFDDLFYNQTGMQFNSLQSGDHCVLYEDVIPKPCYLVAFVAGRLSKVTTSYKTASGRTIELALYMNAEDKSRGAFALSALVKAMRWDEVEFGLEYDLADYRIVAASAFNFGAMENKGLNIFNAALILADPATATDEDYLRIETVVAHEYFHNWSGNRVTVRDWFQLTLKEGLTVYRDQEFIATHHSRAVKRIRDVRTLRTQQFPEDASPLAHPIRPLSYEKVDNFYTKTVYEKGAEVVRMLSVLLGRKRFHTLLKRFFSHFDGMAITVEDFLAFLEKTYVECYGPIATEEFYNVPSKLQNIKTHRSFAAGKIAFKNSSETSETISTTTPWQQFARWYETKGTPIVTIDETYDQAKGMLTVKISQHNPIRTVGTKTALPLLIPLEWALLEVRAPKNGSAKTLAAGRCCLREAREVWTWSNLKNRPYLSLGRAFSAPVKMEYKRSLRDWMTAFHLENDPFNKWDSLQHLLLQFFTEFSHVWRREKETAPARSDEKSWQQSVLLDWVAETPLQTFFKKLQYFIQSHNDLAYIAECLHFPAKQFFMTRMAVVDFTCLAAFEQSWFYALKIHLSAELVAFYKELDFQLKQSDTKQANVDHLPSNHTNKNKSHQNTNAAIKTNSEVVAMRTLKNTILQLLVKCDRHYLSVAREQYQTSTHMSDELIAFKLLVCYDHKNSSYILSDPASKLPATTKVATKLRAAHSKKSTGTVIEHFYERWNHDSLVMNKWLAAQSLIEEESIFTRLVALERSRVYNQKEPNKVYALWGTFAHANVTAFNNKEGRGYQATANAIIAMDQVNPFVSAHLITAFQHVKKLPSTLQQHAHEALVRIRTSVRSKNACEVIKVIMDT
ncbi:aminopeptidase N [Spirochaetota bacterium]|nr:aminopeptidase N [Spirochaetota bacterium]